MNASPLSRFLFAALFLVGLLAGSATVAHALPIVVPDFSADPSGPQFTIAPIGPLDGLSSNLAAPPTLNYAVLDPTTGVDDTLQMNWEPLDDALPAQAGWELVFGVDPDISNQTLSLSISPPGQFNVLGVAAITHLEILVRDANGLSAGIWGFNTEQMGLVVLGNDLLAAGAAPVTQVPIVPGPLASLANNVMQTVTINLGTGPVAGSATVFDGFTTLIGPNYTFPAQVGGSLVNAASLEFYENGNLAGSLALPTGPSPGLNNYWDHISLTPEPSSISLAIVAFIGLVALGWRRRKR